MESRPKPWVTLVEARGQRRLRLFCFPYAGAGTGWFRAWRPALPPEVELALVQLPGREARIGEPAHTRLDALRGPLVQALRPHLDVPFAFFGHSMGALVAFEAARQLQSLGGPRPLRLVASGHRAPHLPSRRPPLHALPDAAFLDELERLGGTTAPLRSNPDLLALLLPMMRADLELCETYRHAAGPPLECALTAYGGAEDPFVDAEELEAWRGLTRGPAAVRRFPGGHFFLHTAAQEVLADLAGRLQESVSPPSLPGATL